MRRQSRCSFKDSDFADAFCASPGGADYAFFLDEATFHQMLTDQFDHADVAEELVAGPRNPGAIPILMRWAAEAGLATHEATLEQALTERPGPFSEGVSGFEEAIGLRPPSPTISADQADSDTRS